MNFFVRLKNAFQDVRSYELTKKNYERAYLYLQSHTTLVALTA